MGGGGGMGAQVFRTLLHLVAVHSNPSVLLQGMRTTCTGSAMCTHALSLETASF